MSSVEPLFAKPSHANGTETVQFSEAGDMLLHRVQTLFLPAPYPNSACDITVQATGSRRSASHVLTALSASIQTGLLGCKCCP